MVNPGKVLKARKSKRQTLHDKHKIERKVREHHRKLRRDARRGVVRGRKKKDPGIPNSWPFKAQLVQQQQEQRETQLAAMIEAREAKKRERAAAKAADEALQRASQKAARSRRDARRKAAAFLPLHDVLADATVLLLVLDARDPLACRCEALEAALRECGKPYILVLNKADLVPLASLKEWLGWLRARGPAIAIASEGEQAAEGLKPLAGLLEKLAGKKGSKRTVQVGVVGFDGVGKRALLRNLRELDQVDLTFGSRVEWLAKPARLQPLSSSLGVNDVLLRRATPEAIAQPEMAVGAVLERCERRPLLKHLQIAAFGTDDEFFVRFGSRVGAESARAAAIAALRHWARGEMPFFTRVPQDEVTENESAAATEALALLSDDVKAQLERRALPLDKVARAGVEGFVPLTAGEAEEIDLSVEDEWDEADVAGAGEEEGNEVGEEDEDMEEDEDEDEIGEVEGEESGEEGNEESGGEEDTDEEEEVDDEGEDD